MLSHQTTKQYRSKHQTLTNQASNIKQVSNQTTDHKPFNLRVGRRQVRLVDKASFSKSWASYQKSSKKSRSPTQSTNETKTLTLILKPSERWVDWNQSASDLADLADFFLQRPKPSPKFFLYTRCYKEPKLNNGSYIENNNTVSLYRPLTRFLL